IARIHNHFYIRIFSRQRLENFHGPVLGGIVDKDVLVSVLAEAGHDHPDTAVQRLHIFFFVVAGRDNTDGLHDASGTKKVLTLRALSTASRAYRYALHPHFRSDCSKTVCSIARAIRNARHSKGLCQCMEHSLHYHRRSPCASRTASDATVAFAGERKSSRWKSLRQLLGRGFARGIRKRYVERG